MCMVKGCEREEKVNELCALHYQRQRKGIELELPVMGRGVDFEKRLLKGIDKSETTSCWLFQGGLNKNGYGKICWNGKKMEAHRASFEYHNKRKIREGMCICHKCDNPRCINPGHLFEGTHQENMQDAVNKGRLKGSSAEWMRSIRPMVLTKLSTEQIKRIKEHVGDLKNLAAELGIGRRYAYKIRKGEKLKGDADGGLCSGDVGARVGSLGELHVVE